MSELEIVDDWYTSGLKGSGSITTIAKDLFVRKSAFFRLGRSCRNSTPRN